MNPHIIKLLMKGHEEKIKEQDHLAWLFNQYTLSAVSVAVEHCLAGRKANSEYINKPFMQGMNQSVHMTEEDKQRAVDLFFAQEKARRVNWRRNHPKSEQI